MKIAIIQGCSGPIGSFVAGTKPVVSDDIGADLIKAGYAELLDADAQPLAPAPELAPETAPESAAPPAPETAPEGAPEPAPEAPAASKKAK